MRQVAERAFVVAAVVGGVIVLALALWKLKVLIALLFLAFIMAAAMRPGVEGLRRFRIPRAGGILGIYSALVTLIGVLLWAVVPRAVDQVQEALGEENLEEETAAASGWKTSRRPESSSIPPSRRP